MKQLHSLRPHLLTLSYMCFENLESYLSLLVEQSLGLVAVDDAPVVRAASDLAQVGHQVVDEVDASVHKRQVLLGKVGQKKHFTLFF